MSKIGVFFPDDSFRTCTLHIYDTQEEAEEAFKRTKHTEFPWEILEVKATPGFKVIKGYNIFVKDNVIIAKDSLFGYELKLNGSNVSIWFGNYGGNIPQAVL